MNIPLEVIERVTGLPLDNREYPHDVITDFRAAAMWSRKEALREAAEIALAAMTSHRLTHPDGDDYAADSRALLVASRIRALAEGDAE